MSAEAKIIQYQPSKNVTLENYEVKLMSEKLHALVIYQNNWLYT